STSTSSTTTASTSTSSTSTSSTTTVTTSTGARSSSSTSSSVLPVAAAPPVTTPPTGTSSGSLPPPVANGVISGSVINDANGNSVADPGEVGISGVLVTLAPVGGPAHAAAQTRGPAPGARQRDASRVDAAINDLNAGLSGGS